jgi:hypothetical protein
MGAHRLRGATSLVRGSQLRRPILHH